MSLQTGMQPQQTGLLQTTPSGWRGATKYRSTDYESGSGYDSHNVAGIYVHADHVQMQCSADY